MLLNLQNIDNNLRNFLTIVNNNHINLILNNLKNIITLLLDNGQFVLITDKKNIYKQYTTDWDVSYLYRFLNMIYNRDIRKIIFNECISYTPDIFNYIYIKTDLNKIHYHNFMIFYNSLDENNKKIYSDYLSYFEL